MIKKIIDAINDVKDIMINRLARVEQKIDFYRDHDGKSIDKLADSLKYQTQFMNTILNNTYGDDKTLETVVYIPYRGKPIVFKDGKQIDMNTVTSFDISWAFDRRTDVTINHE